MNLKGLRGILSSVMYNDTVTILRRQRVGNGDRSSRTTDVPLYEDVPCKLSQYGKGLVTNKTQSTFNVTTDLRICLSPEYDVQPNDVMPIMHEGQKFTLYAGVAFRYPTHQEISVRRQKEGA